MEYNEMEYSDNESEREDKRKRGKRKKFKRSVKIERKYLKEALSLTQKEWKKKGKKQDLRMNRNHQVCKFLDVNVGEIEQNQITGLLTSTQLLLSYLRRSVATGDWPTAATCARFLLDMNSVFLPLVWRTVFLVLLHQKNSSKLNEFLEFVVGLRRVEDKRRLLRRLVTLERAELAPPTFFESKSALDS